MKKLLCLCSYPLEAAASRYRLYQYVGPFRERGIELDIHPFLSGHDFGELYKGTSLLQLAPGIIRGILGRIALITKASNYDAIVVQREAVFFGPALFESIYRIVGRIPIILDLDDATYVRYKSPNYGSIGSFIKFFGKTDSLIRAANLVICGNRFIAQHAETLGAKTVIVPTIVDTEMFRPSGTGNSVPVVGWIGTHSTFPFLERLFPVFQRLAETHSFVLRIVGSGRTAVDIQGVEVDLRDWTLASEIADFQSFDIGLYPLGVTENAPPEWLAGKSGFKAIQYLAVGVPFVVTPVGVCAEIGVAGTTHFFASSDEEWYHSLSRLLREPVFRKAMGVRGRQYAVTENHLEKYSNGLVESIYGILEG